MNILMVTPCIPTTTDGRRPYNFLRYLSRDHRVTVISLLHPAQTDADAEPLRAMDVKVEYCPIRPFVSCLKSATAVLKGEPLRVGWCRYPVLGKMIRAHIESNPVEVIHIDRMRMAQHVIDPSHSVLKSVPKILDFTDSLVMYLERSVEYRSGWKDQFVDHWERRSIPPYERKLLEHMDCALVCSDVDADVFRRDHPEGRFEVIANSVDAAVFKPRVYESGNYPCCVLTGTMFYFPNIDSVMYWKNEILPLLRHRLPDVITRIIGTRPVASIQALHGSDGIEVQANVPDMAAELYTNDVYVCPLRVGAGVRNKLLEAMASGMGIVSTTLGCEGINVRHDEHLLLADTPGAFAEAVTRLFQEPQLRERLGGNARRYVETHHSGEVLGERLLRVYERAAASHR